MSLTPEKRKALDTIFNEKGFVLFLQGVHRQPIDLQ
jgi:hypothetical protein